MTVLIITLVLLCLYLMIMLGLRFKPEDWSWYKTAFFCLFASVLWPIVLALLPLVLVVAIVTGLKE